MPDNFGECRVQVVWKGRGGLKVGELSRMLESQIGKYQAPDVLVIACGTNDLVQTSSMDIEMSLKDTVTEFKKHVPQCKVMFSNVLPRRKYKGARDSKAIDLKRKKINMKMDSFGGYHNVVFHPQFTYKSTTLIKGRPDWVHLTSLGCSVFIQNLRKTLLSEA